MDKIDYVVPDNGSKREERSMKTWKKTVMLRTMIVKVKLTLKVMLDRSKEFILTFDGVEVTDDQSNNNSRDD